MNNANPSSDLIDDNALKETVAIWNRIRDAEIGHQIIKLRKILHIPQLFLKCTLNEGILQNVKIKRIKTASNFYIAHLGITGIPLIIIKHHTRGIIRLLNSILFITLSILLMLDIIKLDIGIVLAYFLIELIILGRLSIYSKLEGMTLFTLLHYEKVMKLEFNISERKFGNKTADIIICLIFLIIVFGLTAYFIFKFSQL